MSAVALLLIAGGVALIALGVSRARGPWARLRVLAEQDANAARYRAWRGGRSTEPGEITGADVMKVMLRQRMRIGIAVAGIGVVLVVVALIARP
jgi:hypothetical protein